MAETENVRVTYADGSVYWQKVKNEEDKGRFAVKEANKLYLDSECIQPASVTRKEKLKETKHLVRGAE
ncbi:hypothetical protein [Priestia aryabhattai]|uniref:hypothetical protein n=1 Tax=Priestia aryabhattai TaxID=412384 RepID=UPI003D267589